MGPGTTMTTTTGSSTTEPSTSSTTTSSSTTDDSTGDPTTAAEETADTGDPLECATGHTCVPEAPEGWNGPVALALTPVGGNVPGCAGDFPDPSLSANDDLDAPPATCVCGCGNASGMSCGNPTLEYHDEDAACIGAPADDWVIDSSCEPIAGFGSDTWLVDPPATTGGSCTPMLAMETVPTASWQTTVTTCTGPFRGIGCDPGSLCVRTPMSPFEQLLCIWTEGASSCPDGVYRDQRTYYTDITDTRDCGACTCETPVGTCGGTVLLFSDTGCTMAAHTIGVDGTCDLQLNNLQVFRARYNEGTASGSCTPSDGMPMGLAAGAGEHTVCCVAI
jgi:hypothetical protein